MERIEPAEEPGYKIREDNTIYTYGIGHIYKRYCADTEARELYPCQDLTHHSVRITVDIEGKGCTKTYTMQEKKFSNTAILNQ